MPTIWVSFTSTWTAFANNRIQINDDDCFAFSCDRLHIFREDDLLPMEITWADRNLSINTKDISESNIPSELLQKWNQFKQILTVANSENRISYRIGNQYEYLKKHPNAVCPRINNA